MCIRWEEIHGFTSPSEYERFSKYISNQVKLGQVEEITPDPEYGPGEIYGGMWFRELASGEIWRLVPPDYPFKGLWEPVKQSD